MKNILLILSIISMYFICGCASVKPTVYEPQKLKQIEKWKIEFKYEPGEIERKMEDNGRSEVKVTTGGRSSRDLQLKDDITFFLQDNYEINIDKVGSSADGQILINPVHFYSGGFKSVDITLADLDGLSLARIRVQNGDRNATFKDDYDFAEYVSKAISDIIKK